MRRVAAFAVVWLAAAASCLSAFADGPDPRAAGMAVDGSATNMASAYIAPENLVLFRMRMPNGSYWEFEHGFDRPNKLYGPGSWRGRVKSETISIYDGDRKKASERTELFFRRGRLVMYREGTKRVQLAYDEPRQPTAGGAPYHFGEEWADESRHEENKKSAASVRRVFQRKWRSSGRFAWPFRNPNENGFLYAALAFLAALAFASSGRRRIARIAWGVVLAASCVALAATASRGAMLALFAGLAPCAALSWRVLLRSKTFWLIFVVAAVAAAAWFGTRGARQLSRGFGDDAWSNRVRVQMWSAAPAMMAEAPDGWSFAHVGRSYMDWYQPLEIVSLPGSLMNDHLTRLAGFGRAWRLGYLFAWFAAFALSGFLALKTRFAALFGMLALYAVGMWFNPVTSRPLLLVPLAAAVVWTLCLRPWRVLRPLRFTALLAGAAILAFGLLAALEWVGSRPPARGYAVTAQGRRVLVKDPAPRIWVVDDGKALGGVLACKEIRAWYHDRPDACGIGYVRSVKDLPERGVSRLLLAGDSGSEWMDMIASKIKGGARLQLPEQVVFLSPAFPPSVLPQGFVDACNAKIVIGEFAARCEPEYDEPPPYVTIVPGMELYIPQWMELVTDSAEEKTGADEKRKETRQ